MDQLQISCGDVKPLESTKEEFAKVQDLKLMLQGIQNRLNLKFEKTRV